MRLRDRIDKKYLKLMGYIIITVGISYALVLALGEYRSIVGTILNGVGWIATVIKPVIIGGVIAYILHPLTRLIERMIIKIAGGRDKKFGDDKSKYEIAPKRKNRIHAASVILAILLVGFVLVAAIFAVVFAITRQVQSVNSDSINTLIESIINQAEAFKHSLQIWLSKLNIGDSFVVKFEQNMIHKLTNLLNNGTNIRSFLSGLAEGTGTLLFSIMFAVYFLFDAANLRRYWGNVVRTIWSQKANDRLMAVYRDVDKVFSGYFRGAAMDSLMVGVLISTMFTIVGMPYGVMIGSVAGVANLIPYMGPIVGYGMTLLAGVVTGEIKTMIISLIIVSMVQVIDGAVINPKLLSKSIEVHPMLVIIAIIAGSKVGGFVGMLVSVPIAAICKVWFERFVDKRRSRIASVDSYEGEPAGDEREPIEV